MSKKKDWRKPVYEAEMKKIKRKAEAERRHRQVGRTKTKAKIVGTLKYGKYGALKKGAKAAGKGAKQAGVGARKAGKAFRDSPTRKAIVSHAENIMSGFDLGEAHVIKTKQRAKKSVAKVKKRIRKKTERISPKDPWDLDISDF